MHASPSPPRIAALEGAGALAPDEPTRGGAVGTFDAVYEHYFDYVYRLVHRLAGPGEHEDLVQDVFVVVHRRLAEFEGRAHITTWLFRIAYRIVGAHVRRERLRRLALRAFGLERCGDYAPPSAPRRIEEAERTCALVEALEALPWKKRSVLVLYELERWECSEIADKLGIPTDTVYTRLHHARRDLAQKLSQRAGGKDSL